MDKLYSPATVTRLMREHDFKFAKSLGQNFLIDGNIVNRIVESAQIKSDDVVIEIGTGLGVLTKAIAKQASKVFTIEIDKRLFPILEETLLNCENVSLLKGDFLKMQLKDILRDVASNSPVKIIGNLPYYISSPIIMKILEENAKEELNIESLTIMVQKEVGERLMAKPATKNYGTLSIAVQYYSEVYPVLPVPRTVFMPRPAVDSLVLKLDLFKKPMLDLACPETFFKVVKKAFEQRRKTLRNSLNGIYGLGKSEVDDLLAQAMIDGERRAETLSLEEYSRIANLLFNNFGN